MDTHSKTCKKKRFSLKTLGLVAAMIFCFSCTVSAQTLRWQSSSEGNFWQKSKLRLSKTAASEPILSVDKGDSLGVLNGFGTCFNEKGWDALNLLSAEEQENIMARLFSPSGDLRFRIGRIPMNASDYARDWYSCDEVRGDFLLAYFNIERDRETLIPYIKMAQKQDPDLWFWTSPWSPPSWMKANNDYPVLSNSEYNTMDPRKDVLLFQGSNELRTDVFPQKLAVNDYLIQDPRYLQAYADFFCKFVEAYAEEGINIRRVMYQNEAWSYTPYPGCAWTAQGIIRFNAEYLGPTMREKHPDVDIFLGTINTNRLEVIEEVMADERVRQTIKGLGFQWEGRQIIKQLQDEYPDFAYVQTESECGSGTFDWAAAEHTFDIMNIYLGLGCQDYTFWNAILADDGTSEWGWRQNALIQIDSDSKAVNFTPEYFAVKHYANVIAPGSKLLGVSGKEDKLPVIVYLSPQGEYEIVAGNLSDTAQDLCVKLGSLYLNATLPAHSFHSFREK